MVLKNNNEIELGDTEKFLKPNEPTVDTKEAVVEFTGLSKEEVMKFGNDPKWVRIRWVLFILFWIVWAGMLAAAILIVAVSDKCPPRPNQSWYDREALYQLDVKTFKDSNNDGLGDLKGLVDKISYFGEINIKTICLNSNLLSDENPHEVNKEFGTLDDLKALRKELDNRDMHLILDIQGKHLATEKDASSVLKFWLISYADGVRVTKYTDDEDTASLFKKWQETVDEVVKKTFKPKILTVYPGSTKLGEETLISNTLVEVDSEVFKSTSDFVAKMKVLYDKDSSQSPFYTLASFDTKRVEERIGSSHYKSLYHALALLLRGNPVLLYGDEIQMGASETYMKWDQSNTCGFSGNVSILDIDNACKKSVREALAHGSGVTLVNLYRELLKLKQEPSLNWGEIKFSDDTKIISYNRVATRFSGYVVAANTQNESYLVNFKELYDLPDESTVEFFYASNGIENTDFEKNKVVSNSNINIKPGELLVLKYNN